VIRSSIRLLAALAIVLTAAPVAFAQQDEDDAVLKLAEPDFTLVGLPTSLRLARFKSAFRVTHRFTRPLGQGDFGDLAGDLFGIDSGALIGLEYRFGIVRNGQIGIHRTSEKTIAFFGEYGVIRQSAQRPFDVTAVLTIDGTNNFKDSYSPSVGAIVSRAFGEFGAVYIEPIWVNNTNPLPAEVIDDNNTFIVGLGTRVRVRPTVYLVGEFAPRVSGFHPGVHHGSFAIEKRAGGHVFQLNFSNSFGTTMANIARGGFRSEDWYMGFNISRKFF
jgi:Membrane bound beta barrel domain (DUF5777)